MVELFVEVKAQFYSVFGIIDSHQLRKLLKELLKLEHGLFVSLIVVYHGIISFTMIVTIPSSLTSGKKLVVIPLEEYEALVTLKKVYEFQPTSAQKKALEKARKNRKKGEMFTLGELKQKLGLTD